MTKKLGWPLAVVALIGVALAYHFSSAPVKPSGSTGTDPQGNTSGGKASPVKDGGFKSAGAKPTTSVVPSKGVPQTKSREQLQAEIREIELDLARIATPAKQQEMVDSNLKAREPEYRSLFQSWDLDPATVKKVFQIIRQRDARNMEITYTPDEEFSSTRGTTRHEQRNRETQWAELELGALLGSERAAQVSRLEAKMQAELIARGVAQGKALAKEREKKEREGK